MRIQTIAVYGVLFITELAGALLTHHWSTAFLIGWGFALGVAYGLDDAGRAALEGRGE